MKGKSIKQLFGMGALLLITLIGISYAYFRARILGNEITSTLVATAANLELTFEDGTPTINGDSIIPGWSKSKTFSVENTGDVTAYYALKITDITNTFTIPNSISFEITSSDGGANVKKHVLPSASTNITSKIEIDKEEVHNYTITTYYNNLDVDQSPDLGKSFSYTITIVGVRDSDDILLTFDANGGEVSEYNRIVQAGNTYGTLPTPTRTGYEFLGWNGKNLFSG